MEIGLSFSQEIDLKKLKRIRKREELLTEKMISANSVVSEMNEKYSGEQDIPNNKFAYAALFSKAPSFIRQLYPFSENHYRITILGRAIDVLEYEVLIKKIKRVLDQKKITKYKINGVYYNLMISQKEMVSTLFKSFFTSLLFDLFVLPTLYLGNNRIKDAFRK